MPSNKQPLLWIALVLACFLPVSVLVSANNNEPEPPPKRVVAPKAVERESAEAPPPVYVPPPAPAYVPPPVYVPPVVSAAGGLPVPVLVPNPTGADALAMEQRLSQLGYMVGNVDGVIDGATKHGITAFQKYENLARIGTADPGTLQRLASATQPIPQFSSPPDHFEVDIPRQVVLVVRGGKVTAVVPTSTGNNKLFTSQGYTRRAVTPNGQFQINFKRNGWRKAPLGDLYRPSYFNGGIAFHGARSVPASPASHGCVRIPMQFADWFADNAPVGMVVYVYGGPTGENPQPVLDEPAAVQAAVPAAASAPAAAPPAAAPPAAAPPPDPGANLLGNLLSN